MIESVVGLVGGGVLLLGLALASIGLYGLLRKPGIFEQLHAAGLVTGSGAILVLLAALASGSAEIATSAVLVVAFMLVTSSLSTHAIAFAAWRVAAPATGADDRPDEAASGAGDRRDGAAADGGPVVAAGTARTLRVLVAHDGSPGAAVATSLTASLAWPDEAAIRVVGVAEGDLDPLASVDPGEPAAGADRDDLAAVLAEAVDRIRRPQLSVDAVVRRGQPATTIVLEAEAFGADLIVIGSRGLGPVRSLLAGSIAASVVDAAPCPVLVARTTSIQEVLLATDGSAAGDAATTVTATWPMFEGVHVHVLSVATSVPHYGTLPAWAGMHEAAEVARQQKVADAATVRLLDARRRALPHVLAGDAAARIVGFADGRSIDLVVIGSRGRTGLRRAVLGSVGRAVLSSARSSVLIVQTPPVGRDAGRDRAGPDPG